MALLKEYPEGSDITLLNTIYKYGRKDEDTGKYKKDFLEVVCKDNITGKKFHKTIYEPEYEFYMAKDDIFIDHNLFFIEKDKVDAYRTPFNQLEKTIAELTGNENFYYENIKAGNRKANKELHTLYNVFNSDMNIEDNFRFRFSRDYPNNIIPLSKSYFDIEVDGIDMKGDFPEMGECPINAVSYIDDQKKTEYVYLLRNPDNPLIEEFEKSINADLFKELKEFVIKNVGGIDKAKKYKIDELEFEFKFYDEEIQLIHDLFIEINKNQPDFLLAWNMAFDVPYIIERIKNLGYNPEDIMCHPDFTEERVANYYIDERNRNEYAERGDFYEISSYTVYLDQLIHFASRRKGQRAFPNFKLDTAGEIIAGVNKLDYSHITTSIVKLPYLDYKTFVFYNIMDTIVQKCIEEQVADIDYIFGKCNLNNTRYSKGHRQTVYLTNRGTKDFYNDGFIIGNNSNRHNQKVKFPGALVGDPLHNSDYAKIKINGEALNLANNLDDYDYKSLYPSITREHNMAPNTQIGKIYIDPEINRIYPRENIYNYEFYERGGQFLEDLCSGNILDFSNRWFGFATFREFLDDIAEYYSTRDTIYQLNPYENGLYKPIRHMKENLTRPIYYSNDLIKPMIYYPESLDYTEYLNKINNY